MADGAWRSGPGATSKGAARHVCVCRMALRCHMPAHALQGATHATAQGPWRRPSTAHQGTRLADCTCARASTLGHPSATHKQSLVQGIAAFPDPLHPLAGAGHAMYWRLPATVQHCYAIPLRVPSSVRGNKERCLPRSPLEGVHDGARGGLRLHHESKDSSHTTLFPGRYVKQLATTLLHTAHSCLSPQAETPAETRPLLAVTRELGQELGSCDTGEYC